MGAFFHFEIFLGILVRLTIRNLYNSKVIKELTVGYSWKNTCEYVLEFGEGRIWVKKVYSWAIFHLIFLLLKRTKIIWFINNFWVSLCLFISSEISRLMLFQFFSAYISTKVLHVLTEPIPFICSHFDYCYCHFFNNLQYLFMLAINFSFSIAHGE